MMYLRNIKCKLSHWLFCVAYSIRPVENGSSFLWITKSGADRTVIYMPPFSNRVWEVKVGEAQVTLQDIVKARDDNYAKRIMYTPLPSWLR